ncbi:MAG TPA: alkaline phosphatase family protein, partial [Candidatus Polarisedimenticolia bacterium]|nr:alkaline phosphatase family protein [Candidatus Polarisedimenticolia bacterium]
MPRKTGLLLPASLLAAVALLALSFLAHVPPDSHALVRSAFGGGSPRVLGPGWHFRIPLYQVLHRYPSDVIRLEGVEEVSSSEGVSLRAPYSFSARIEPSRLAIFDEHARGREAKDFLREVMKRTLSAWAAEESAARWGAGESRSAPAAVTGEIGALGLTDVALTIGKTAVPPQVGKVAALESLRGRARETGRKIVLVGLDGADWQLIDPWIREGKLPTLRRLKEKGAWANLKSMQPILSPLLWTTVATGRRPEDHGVVDFLVRDPGTGQKVPISSRFRKVAALWNIFSEMGRKVDVVAWWASWPAEPVNGAVVSDRVSYSLFGYQADAANLPGATYSAGYLASLRGRLVKDRDIGLEEVRRFAKIDAADFRERRAQIDQTDPRKAYADPVNHLTRVLAATRNYESIALDLLSRGQPDLMMIYFQGIDEVGHRFQHMMPPRMAMVSPQDYERFNGTVEAFYRHQDKIVGEILARADPRSLVVVLSDHGFKNGSSRPTDDPPYIEGKPGKWHRLYGIFLLSGPGVKQGQIDTVSLMDIAPTVLALAGIPPSREMPGRVLAEAFEAREAAGLSAERVATYEVARREPGTSVADASAADREMIENLRSLGYIGGAGDAGGSTEPTPGSGLSGDTVTYHSNLAALQLKAKHYDQAEAEVNAALRLIPDYLPALMTQASIFQATKRPQDALQVYRRVAESGEAESGVFTALANLYVKTGGVDQGITEFS